MIMIAEGLFTLLMILPYPWREPDGTNVEPACPVPKASSEGVSVGVLCTLGPLGQAGPFYQDLKRLFDLEPLLLSRL